VYLANEYQECPETHEIKKRKIAAKVVKFEDDVPAFFIRETALLRDVQHRNVIQ